MKWEEIDSGYWKSDARMAGEICVYKTMLGKWTHDYRVKDMPNFFYDPIQFDTKEEAMNVMEVWHDGMLEAEKILAGIADKDV